MSEKIVANDKDYTSCVSRLITKLKCRRKMKVHIIPQYLLGRNFLAICLFGFVFAVRPLNAVELNHERIHAAQQRELLYIPFFLWYVVEWLLLLMRYRDGMKAYRHIRFEEEAYRHERDFGYLERRRHWRYGQA